MLTNIASGVDGEARVSSEIGLAALLLSGTTTAIGEDGTANLLCTAPLIKLTALKTHGGESTSL